METDIAIQQDATETGAAANQQGTPPEDGAQEAPLSPREAAMAAIEDQIARQREEQGVAAGEGAAPAEVAAGEGAASVTSTDDRQQDRQAAPVSTDPPQQAERMLTVKIDGVEMQLPESEVIKGFQKDAAASRRLEEAALKLKEIEERERALSGKEQATQAPAAGADQAGNAGTADDPAELARKILDGFVEGNLDEATQALTEALKVRTQPNATPVVDASQVEEIIQQQLTAKDLESDYRRAKEMFDTDYAEINQNPRLAQMCNTIYFEHLEAGKRPSEAAKLAGDEVKSLVAPAPTRTAQTTRQERKQNMDSITPAAAHVAAPGQDNASNDPTSVIAEMKRARGQT